MNILVLCVLKENFPGYFLAKCHTICSNKEFLPVSTFDVLRVSYLCKVVLFCGHFEALNQNGWISSLITDTNFGDVTGYNSRIG